MIEELPNLGGQESIKEKKEKALAYAREKIRVFRDQVFKLENEQLDNPDDYPKSIDEELDRLDRDIAILEEAILLINRDDEKVINKYHRQSRDPLVSVG